jgi:hypothetical protein
VLVNTSHSKVSLIPFCRLELRCGKVTPAFEFG